MILINFASRSRPAKFHACMDNLAECFTDYTVCVKVDSDDPKLKEYLSRPYPEADFHIGLSGSKVTAINRDITEPFDILINTSDDILWHRHAGKVITEQMDPDTFLHFPEVYADGQAKSKGGRATISVVSIMDWIYYHRFGYVYNPIYKSLCADNEATEVARMLGRYKFVDDYIFEHIHPAAGYDVKDAQYVYTESFYWRDKGVFKTREALGFP